MHALAQDPLAMAERMVSHAKVPAPFDFCDALASSDRSMRDKIERLEAHMLAQPQVEIEPVHHFAHGIYAREITIKAGTLLTGKIHKTEHLNIVSKGRIAVWTEDGMKEVAAPFTMVSRPGTKRVGYALEDTVWTTIHATPETDLDKLEVELIAATHDDVQIEYTTKELAP
jgi:hypothetical protein